MGMIVREIYRGGKGVKRRREQSRNCLECNFLRLGERRKRRRRRRGPWSM